MPDSTIAAEVHRMTPGQLARLARLQELVFDCPGGCLSPGELLELADLQRRRIRELEAEATAWRHQP